MAEDLLFEKIDIQNQIILYQKPIKMSSEKNYVAQYFNLNIIKYSQK
jgi:hypothetical protein